jgi:hypothetical protein
MNLFPKTQRPYCIYTPSYTHKSSGVRTLHLLCHALNEMGQKAYLVSGDIAFASNPHLNTPLLSAEYQNFYYKEGIDPITVYPDIVKGNPLNAKNVVRYLLAPRGAYGGDSAFPDTDQIWGALPSIAKNVLRIPVSDTSIFYPPKHEDEYDAITYVSGLIPRRKGSCFYSHKYEMHGNKLLDVTKDSIRLEGSLENIADILRKSTVCYLYEVSSILTEAALCGCPVVLVNTPYFNTIDPDCMMGQVEWSDGYPVKECDDYLPEYQKIIRNFEINLADFIVSTHRMANERD